jgi:hypothetical protein
MQKKAFYIPCLSVVLLFFCWSCKPKPKFSVVMDFDLTKQIDSTAFGDIKFGITRSEFLSGCITPPIENRITEPFFDGLITELESPVSLGEHNFTGYYYFDAEDSLYKVVIIKHSESKYPRVYHAAYDTLHQYMRTRYGKGKPVPAMEGEKRLYWGLKNKKIELSDICFQGDCIIECTVTETRLFEKNKKKARGL